jgi:hypothetical protein
VSTPPPPTVRPPRRAPAIVAILLLLALAGIANATIKRNRVSAGNAPSAAISSASTHGSALSVAWYCAGPLPLGLKSERSSLILANISDRTVLGEYSVATESGVIASHSVDLAAQSSTTIVLPAPPHSAYAAATVLANGAGLAVSEEIRGPEGSDTSACVDHATQTQYLAGGGTTRPDAVALALFDPGATPSVVNIAFATPTGDVAPPAYQGLPIAAGATLVINAGQYLPSQELIGTTVTSSGGPVVLGSLISAVSGTRLLSSLASGTAVAQRSWWLAPAPAGTIAAQRFAILNPGATPAAVTLTTVGDDGPAAESVNVPAGGIAQLAPASDESASALRWATVTATVPVVVSRATTLLGPLHSPKTKRGTHTPAISGIDTTISELPIGYTIGSGTPALAREWLVGAAGSNAREGELVLLANPNGYPVNVAFTSLSGGAVPADLVVGAGDGVAVPVPASSGSVLIVSATGPVVVDSGSYSRGSSAAIGWSSPGAIVIN